MSRHSKNNTANCVFTYGERLKLKKQNEWGDISSRIGSDSQKKFEQCGLCLNMIENPLSCKKGHIFCKNCIVENLFHQKTEINKKLKEWEEYNKNKVILENNLLENKKKAKEENLITVEDKIAHFDVPKMGDNTLLTEEEINKLQVVENFNIKKKKIHVKDKTELVKNCFWIPERTPETITENVKKPDENLECPLRQKNHYLKLKELISLKLRRNQDGNKYICSLCEKELNFQKIIAIKNCGDVMCQKCFETVCKKDSICSVCSSSFVLSDIINLQESGTCYSQHSQVETSKLNPYFKY